MTPNSIQQFHASLIINGTLVTIESARLDEIQNTIQRILGQPAASFLTDKLTGLTTVLHPHYGEGKLPVGWFNSMQVPEHLSVKALTRSVQAVAA